MVDGESFQVKSIGMDPRRIGGTLLVAALGLVFFLLISIFGGKLMAPDAGTLVAWGGNVDSLSLGAQPWRLLSSIFIHNGLLHFLVATAVLILVGLQLERRTGTVIFLLVFFVSGLTAAFWSAVWHNNLISVGSNGAIWGMIGALFSLFALGSFPKRRMIYVASVAIPFLLIDLFNVMGNGADLWLNLGGFLSGLLWGVVLRQGIKQPRPVVPSEPAIVADAVVVAEPVAEEPEVEMDSDEISPEMEEVVDEPRSVQETKPEAEDDLSRLLAIPPDSAEVPSPEKNDQPHDS